MGESSTAGILVWSDREGWVAPPEENVFDSITVAIVQELAAANHIGFRRRSVSRGEMTAAGEVLWCSTPVGLRAVTSVDGQSIGDGVPGRHFKHLACLFSERVGIDILAALH